jgi:hypothetical protein
MSTRAPSEIESEFAQLPADAQLALLERLVHQVRIAVSRHGETWEAELALMAADPQIRQEIEKIEMEFSATEADGLPK